MQMSLVASLVLMVGLSSSGVLMAGAESEKGAPATAAPVEAVFREWISVFNSGDKAGIKAFYGRYLDDPEPTFAIDQAEGTCGFDVVRVESETETQTPLAMSVLLAERCFPALHRLTIKFAAPGDTGPKEFKLKSFALSPQSAIDVMVATADRLATRDKFAGALLVANGNGEVWSKGWGTLNKT